MTDLTATVQIIDCTACPFGDPCEAGECPAPHAPSGTMLIRVAPPFKGSRYRWGVWLDDQLMGRGYADSVEDAEAQAHDCVDPEGVRHVTIEA